MVMLYWAFTLILGLVFLLSSEFYGVSSLRIVAASLLILGGGGLGVCLAWSNAPSAGLNKLNVFFRHCVVCLIAIILTAPVVIVLLKSLVGATKQAVDRVGSVEPLLLAGGFVGLTMLVLVVVALAIGVGAIFRKQLGRSGAN